MHLEKEHEAGEDAVARQNGHRLPSERFDEHPYELFIMALLSLLAQLANFRKQPDMAGHRQYIAAIRRE